MQPADNEQPEHATSYVFPVTASELARLNYQDAFMTRLMGGLFPEWDGSRPLSFSPLLDIACGPGGWATEVARTFPEVAVFGFDISPLMVEYANESARVQEVFNAQFKVMDATRPLLFPDGQFSYINARFLAAALTRSAWSSLLTECRRVSRRGALIRLTEPEEASTSASSVEELNHAMLQAMHRKGLAATPWKLGLTPHLGGYLQDAGYVQIRSRAWVVDWSAGTENHAQYCQNMQAAYAQAEGLLIGTGVLDQPTYEEMKRAAIVQMYEPNFRALWYYLTVWGEVPR